MLGMQLDLAGNWLEGDAGMLLNPQQCNLVADQYACQEQCLLDGRCVAWMFGLDGDRACQQFDDSGNPLPYDEASGSGCPQKVRAGGGAGACWAQAGEARDAGSSAACLGTVRRSGRSAA